MQGLSVESPRAATLRRLESITARHLHCYTIPVTEPSGLSFKGTLPLFEYDVARTTSHPPYMGERGIIRIASFRLARSSEALIEHLLFLLVPARSSIRSSWPGRPRPWLTKRRKSKKRKFVDWKLWRRHDGGKKRTGGVQSSGGDRTRDGTRNIDLGYYKRLIWSES